MEKKKKAFTLPLPCIVLSVYLCLCSHRFPGTVPHVTVKDRTFS